MDLHQEIDLALGHPEVIGYPLGGLAQTMHFQYLTPNRTIQAQGLSGGTLDGRSACFQFIDSLPQGADPSADVAGKLDLRLAFAQPIAQLFDGPGSVQKTNPEIRTG